MGSAQGSNSAGKERDQDAQDLMPGLELISRAKSLPAATDHHCL